MKCPPKKKKLPSIFPILRNETLEKVCIFIDVILYAYTFPKKMKYTEMKLYVINS